MNGSFKLVSTVNPMIQEKGNILVRAAQVFQLSEDPLPTEVTPFFPLTPQFSSFINGAVISWTMPELRKLLGVNVITATFFCQWPAF
jgi:hypothetical protein